jgi:hypothetical protein
LILAFRPFGEKLKSNTLCVLFVSVVSNLFIRAGGIFVDETILFFAEDGLKGTTATRAVGPFILRPAGITAV